MIAELLCNPLQYDGLQSSASIPIKQCSGLGLAMPGRASQSVVHTRAGLESEGHEHDVKIHLNFTGIA